jgi:hypothetical protein
MSIVDVGREDVEVDLGRRVPLHVSVDREVEASRSTVRAVSEVPLGVIVFP